jgi:hypothetical protein
MSSWFGDLKHWSKKIEITALTNSLKGKLQFTPLMFTPICNLGTNV